MKSIFSLGSHQQHTQHFTDACESAGINLTNIDRVRLEQLLEHHTVMCMFPSCNTDSVRLECTPDRSMAKSIIWCRRLLDEPESVNIEFCGMEANKNVQTKA